jgi:hypothetical protein
MKKNVIFYNIRLINSYLNKFMSTLKLEEKFKNDDDYEDDSVIKLGGGGNKEIKPPIPVNRNDCC